MASVKIELLAVSVTVPLTALGVRVAEGLLSAIVNSEIGTVRDRVATVHVELFAPRTIENGAKSSFTTISVSALCVKYVLSISMALLS